MITQASRAIQQISRLKKGAPGQLIDLGPLMDIQTAPKGVFVGKQFGHRHPSFRAIASEF
jgi:hypothetical protein